MISDKHAFNVWHPMKDGGLPKFTSTVFHFAYACSRTDARYQVEKVEGFVIQRKKRGKK